MLVHGVLTIVQTVTPRQNSAARLVPVPVRIPFCMQYGPVHLAKAEIMHGSLIDLEKPHYSEVPGLLVSLFLIHEKLGAFIPYLDIS